MKSIDFFGIAFLILCLGFCSFGLSKLQTNTEDVLQWLPDQSEARTKYDYFESKFGSDDTLIVTWQGCTINDDRLVAFAQRIRQRDGGKLFQRITTGTETISRLAKQFKLSRPQVQAMLRGIFFGLENPDHTCALLELSNTGGANRTETVKAAWEALDHLEIDRSKVTIGGYPYIATFIDEQLKNSFRGFLFPSVFFSTVLALLCLRSLKLTLIVFITAAGATVTSVSFIPICNMKYGGLMSIIPALVFILAISGSIHLIRYSLNAIGDTRKLLAIGWRPCAVSAATTSIGMLSLMRSDFPAIRNFGLFCATGVGFAFLFQMTMVPWLLGRFGTSGLQKMATRNQSSRSWQQLATLVQRYRFPISLGFTLIAITGGISLTQLKAEVEVEKLFQPDSEILVSIANLETQMGPMEQTELLVVFENDGTPEFVDRFPERVKFIRRLQASVAKAPGVDVIYSLINFFPDEPAKTNARSFFQRATYRNLLRRERQSMANGNLLHCDKQEETWRITLRFPFTKKQDFSQIKSSVLAAAGRVSQVVPGSENLTGTETPSPSLSPKIIYTGKTHLFNHAQLNLLSDLFLNFLLAFVIITPVLIIVLRSVSIGLIAMIPNLFPTLVVFGGLGLAGCPVDLAIAMAASVALGIAVDDTTHFLMRFRDFGGSLKNVSVPVVETLGQCGPAMLHTTLIAGAGIFSYYFSNMLVISRFSWSIASLLAVALIADVLMLPAILFVFAKDKSKLNPELPKSD